jgi:hypothetical protein
MRKAEEQIRDRGAGRGLAGLVRSMHDVEIDGAARQVEPRLREAAVADEIESGEPHQGAPR